MVRSRSILALGRFTGRDYFIFVHTCFKPALFILPGSSLRDRISSITTPLQSALVIQSAQLSHILFESRSQIKHSQQLSQNLFSSSWHLLGMSFRNSFFGIFAMAINLLIVFLRKLLPVLLVTALIFVLYYNRRR